MPWYGLFSCCYHCIAGIQGDLASGGSAPPPSKKQNMGDGVQVELSIGQREIGEIAKGDWFVPGLITTSGHHHLRRVHYDGETTSTSDGCTLALVTKLIKQVGWVYSHYLSL